MLLLLALSRLLQAFCMVLQVWWLLHLSRQLLLLYLLPPCLLALQLLCALNSAIRSGVHWVLPANLSRLFAATSRRPPACVAVTVLHLSNTCLAQRCNAVNVMNMPLYELWQDAEDGIAAGSCLILVLTFPSAFMIDVRVRLHGSFVTKSYAISKLSFVWHVK
jgi:hypothetical protein